MTRTLEEIAEFLGHKPFDEVSNIIIKGLSEDSRRIKPGYLFVLRGGTSEEIERFVGDAETNGALAVLSPEDVEFNTSLYRLNCPSPATILSELSEFVYDYPSRALKLIGITGTNGKTTISWILWQALEALGKKTARIGTLGYQCGKDFEDFGMTTPGADRLVQLLERARQSEAEYAVLEVSSHGLELGRVEALSFEVAAFSNLTQDHLDFHQTMEAYEAAKARFFTALSPRHSIICIDSAAGSSMLARAEGKRCAVSSQSDVELDPTTASSQLQLVRRLSQERSSDYFYRYNSREFCVSSSLMGQHNAQNIALAAAILLELGYESDAVANAIGTAKDVPGRLERCDQVDDDLVVLVDYAHTPDALNNVLQSCLETMPKSKKLWCLFGAGGDRDRAKRALMAKVVEASGAAPVVTTDNPRSEEPQSIIDEILGGFENPPAIVQIDRRLAIAETIATASPGDWILLCGKGHENYQDVMGVKNFFDDRQEARTALVQRKLGGIDDGGRDSGEVQ